MSDIKTQVQGIDPNVEARDLKDISAMSSNIYESISIMAKRANYLGRQIKQELQGKLEEFAVTSDTIEEIQENKEQIEISKFYEKLPNPAVIAINEFMNNELKYSYKDQKEEEEI